MNDRDIFTEIKDLFCTYNIGNVIKTPVSIQGGLLHKMYQVTTDTTIYALKWLNPSIMQRNGVLDHMIQSERIASYLSDYVPVVAALSFDGLPVLPFHDHYYMVFPWMEGTSIFPPHISEKHCFEIGSALGKIHQLDISIPEIKREVVSPFNYDWRLYNEKGIIQKATWIDRYESVINNLILWTNHANDANIKLSENRVISHRDLDPKNVMWNQGIPYFIDWEAAGYVNPYQELLEVLNYWADHGNGDLDHAKFNILLQSYRKYSSTEKVDWDCVLASGYSGMLGWLEYSLKRALGMEGSGEEEISLGAEQIVGTIRALEKYDTQIKTMKLWLSE